MYTERVILIHLKKGRRMKKITKIKTSKEEQTLKKYLLTVKKISQLTKVRKELMNTIINDILNVDVENSKKSLHHKTIGNVDIVLKLSNSYSINQSEIAKVIPEILTSEKSKSKYHKKNSVRKDLIVEVNND
mgnify:FL=1